jgi:hypothetical protein
MYLKDMLKSLFSPPLLAFFFLCFAFPAHAQDFNGVSDTAQISHEYKALEQGISFSIWDQWQLNSKEQNKGSLTLNFTRKAIVIDGISYVATFSFIAETLKGAQDIRTYSTQRLVFFQNQKEFELLKTFTSSDGRFSVPYTIGYEAQYSDSKSNVHRLWILHGLNNRSRSGLQAFSDVPEEIWPILEEEITAIWRSLQYQ